MTTTWNSRLSADARSARRNCTLPERVQAEYGCRFVGALRRRRAVVNAQRVVTYASFAQRVSRAP